MNIVRQTSELQSLKELDLSNRTQAKIMEKGLDLKDIVRLGRIDFYELQRQPRIKIPHWRRELMTALNKTGFIRHDLGRQDTFALNRFRKKVFKLPLYQSLISDIESLTLEDGVYESFVLNYAKDLKTIQRMLAPLKERERIVIKMRLGIEYGTPKTLAEVGAIFNITYGHARQIESRAMHRLQLRGDKSMVDELIEQIETCGQNGLLEEEAKSRLKLKKFIAEDKSWAANYAELYLIKKDGIEQDSDIKSLHLSTREENCLRNAEINTVAQVIERCYQDKLDGIPGLGRITARKIVTKLIQLDCVDKNKVYPEPELELLGLSRRAKSCLKQADKITISSITAMTEEEMMKIEGLGYQTFKEIKHKLAIHGHSLKS